ncbi:YncE family protein [Rhodobacter sp. 24-YEA-8]|uniref:YncE family protein n=1 Tax=Rhodobacter sp. 24-YEA-8 TaxID=1884310 RepID=UPI000894D3BF|nr:YncE family protein [Rhodobacter sp. 24-YEA-8]SEC15371.1 40-residue YVTN family beta-propeller repeat-containing protein [Rhodobacter sp. 24-YEA-8]
MGFPFLTNGYRKSVFGLTLAALVLPGAVLAESSFPAPVEFEGRFRVIPAEPGKPVLPGSSVTIEGSGLKPGQTLVLQRGTAVLSRDALTADDNGAVSFTFTLPEDAATGLHPVIAIMDQPSSTSLFDVKVSKDVPLSGTDGFSVTRVKSAPGLYQSVYSAKSNALFVAAASFRPPAAALLKLNPETLDVVAEVTPPPLPEDQRRAPAEGQPDNGPQPVALFGLAVDDEKGTIWGTNTFDNSVAVYAQDDLSLIRQFPPGEVYHARDVKVDAKRGRAYVSASATNGVHVFDTETLEKVAVIEITSGIRGGEFSLMSIAVDPDGNRLFAVSRKSNELAVIDLTSNTVTQVLPLPGAKNASGVDFDAATGTIYVASQDSDNLLIVDLASGEVRHDVTTGAGALNVVFDPVQKLAFVSNRGAGTVTVVSPEGEIVANLDGGSYPNHVATDGKGNVFAANKSLGAEDATADHIALIHKAN